METSIALLVLALASVCYGLPTSRIVNGTAAADKQYPYQVSVLNNGRHLCGGTILNKRHILTAAHCFHNKSVENMGIIYGVADLGDSNGLYLKAEKLISHENFVFGKLHDDIAVMKLEKEIPYSSKAQPTILPTSAAINTPFGTFTGWGRKSYKGAGERYLQQIELKLLPTDQCRKIMPFVTPVHLCTLNKIGEGVCIGDSGGPLVVDTVQVGVASFNIPCAQGAPDVFTRVYDYVDWIRETAGMSY